MKESCSKVGFTLIELLVVVLIIGILAAVAMPQYQKAVEKSRLAEVLMNIETVMKNVDLLILENGEESSDIWQDPANWMTDLSGGTWSEGGHGFYYTTKNFVYTTEDGAGIDAYRCARTCTGDYDTDVENSSYDLWQDYRITSNEGESSHKVCWGHDAVGKYICKSLTSQGWEDRSEE